MARRQLLDAVSKHLGGFPGLCCHDAPFADDSGEVAVALCASEPAQEVDGQDRSCGGGAVDAAADKPRVTDADGADESTTLCEAAADAAPELPGAGGRLSAADPRAAAIEVVQTPQRPDFSGVWVLARFEGDMDLFLRETGIGFVTRSALAAAGYGVGSMQNTITHTGDVLEIITKCLGRTHSVKFVADGAEHDAKDPVDGRPVKFLASWEEDGHSMRVTGHWAQSGKAVPEMRRFMEGGEMHVQQTASTGRAVTRVFRRA